MYAGLLRALAVRLRVGQAGRRRPIKQTRLAAGYKGEQVALKEARKHAAWYLKGVHGAARLRGRTGSLKTLSDLEGLIQDALEEEQKAASPL